MRAVVEVIEATPDAQLRGALVQAMISMLGDPLVAVVREMLMNPIVTPPSPAYLALRRDIEAVGEVRGRAESLFAVLAARRLLVDDATRGRIEGCTDGATLEHWIARAATATTLDEVFGRADDAE